VGLAISSILVFIICAELILYSVRDLTPPRFLGMCIAKLGLWTVAFALNILAFWNNWSKDKWNKIYLDVTIGFSSAIL
jgi:hypothetical protein